MFCAGVKYLDDCPLERRVPVYLLVGGSFLALKLIGMLWKNLQLRRYDNMDAFYDRSAFWASPFSHSWGKLN